MDSSHPHSAGNEQGYCETVDLKLTFCHNSQPEVILFYSRFGNESLWLDTIATNGNQYRAGCLGHL